MHLLIIEDEVPAAERLRSLLSRLMPEAEIGEHIDSVEDAVERLGQEPVPDLIFMDVELADGLSFDIFRKATITSPVIFVTAYDHYAVKAFQVDGLHYVLKPIEEKALQKALEKFEEHRKRAEPSLDYQQLLQLLDRGKQNYKERFLIKQGGALSFVPAGSVAWFQAQSGYVCLTTHEGLQSVVDFTLDALSDRLDPGKFFQANRKFIVSIEAIRKIEPYFNGRLLLHLHPAPGDEVIVSRDRAARFKAWLDR